MVAFDSTSQDNWNVLTFQWGGVRNEDILHSKEVTSPTQAWSLTVYIGETEWWLGIFITILLSPLPNWLGTNLTSSSYSPSDGHGVFLSVDSLSIMIPRILSYLTSWAPEIWFYLRVLLWFGLQSWLSSLGLCFCSFWSQFILVPISHSGPMLLGCYSPPDWECFHYSCVVNYMQTVEIYLS